MVKSGVRPWQMVVSTIIAVALAVGVLVVFLDPIPNDPDTTIRPVESYDSRDLREAVRELRRLRGTRLTPAERHAVGVAAEALGRIVDGDAVIAPTPTAPAPTVTVINRPPATTTTTTTTTEPPPPTTDAPMPVRDMVGQILDDIPV